MAKLKKSWQEKLTSVKDFPKILKFGPNVGPCRKALESWGAKTGDTVVLAPHIEVDEIMKKVPEGKIITIKEICGKLAQKYGTNFCCPLVAGISTWIASHAAEGKAEEGEKDITPYWRTLKAGGVLNEKYPGGAERQKKLLEKEGLKVTKKGKKYLVVNFEKYLVRL